MSLVHWSISRFARRARCAAGLALTLSFTGGALAQNAVQPIIQGFSLREGRFYLHWTSPAGSGPQVVESRDNATGSSWAPIPEINWPQSILEFTDPRPLVATRLYRVVTPPPVILRGRLIESNFVSRLTRPQIGLLLMLYGITLPLEYDVNYYKLVYETVGPSGEKVTASGGLAIPENPKKPLPLATYQHGTVVLRTDVPSRLNTEGAVAIAMAATGYVTAAPDYLGLGDSSLSYHPYHHSQSEANAVVDMLRATRAFATGANLALNSQVFLFGYSEGGHATMAAHRELEIFHAPEFTVTASAPGAGAYDLAGATLEDFFSGRPLPNPYYFAYFIHAYRNVYGFAPTMGSLLRPPYDQTIPPLFDGAHDSAEINSKLPAVPLEAMDPAFLNDFRDHPETNPVRIAIRANDILDWIPKARTRLFHCSGDRDVVFKNSEVAVARLKANGGLDVELVSGGDHDHAGCVPFAMLGAKALFDSLRQ